MTEKIREGILFIQKLSFYKIYNIILLRLSYTISRKFRKPFHLGKPLGISIEPTTSCNLRCPECPSGLRSFSRSTGMLDEAVYEVLINEVAPYISYLSLYFQGEPYLNPNFLKFVRYASKKNIFTATSTNAHYFDEEISRKTVQSGLDKLIISIDGTDQDTYAKYRVGGNLDKVIQGTERLIKWKKKLKSKRPFIILQFIVFKSNQHQLNRIKEIAKQLGVDKLSIKTAQIYNFESKSDIIPDNSQYSRYKKLNGVFAINNTMSNNCWRMWSSCVITWDGKMVPCCFDKDAHYVLGDVYKKKFINIWKSDAQQEFRQRVLKSRKDIDICKNCSEGSKIWV